MLLQEPVGEISPLGQPGMAWYRGCSPGLTVQHASCPLDRHGNSAVLQLCLEGTTPALLQDQPMKGAQGAAGWVLRHG